MFYSLDECLLLTLCMYLKLLTLSYLPFLYELFTLMNVLPFCMYLKLVLAFFPNILFGIPCYQQPVEK